MPSFAVDQAPARDDDWVEEPFDLDDDTTDPLVVHRFANDEAFHNGAPKQAVQNLLRGRGEDVTDAKPNLVIAANHGD